MADAAVGEEFVELLVALEEEVVLAAGEPEELQARVGLAGISVRRARVVSGSKTALLMPPTQEKRSGWGQADGEAMMARLPGSRRTR